MISILLAVVFLAISVFTAVLRKVYFSVTARELKRQAAEGNHAARELWSAVGYGRSLHVLLWLVMSLFGALGLVLMATEVPSLFAVLVAMIVFWLLFSWLPGTRVSSTAIRFTHTVNPSVVWLLQHGEPFLHQLERPFSKHYTMQHSGLYELHDLLDLLDLQVAQDDNRIAADQLAAVRAALEFNDLRVRDVVRLHAKTVALTDTVGPILLHELHAAGQAVFPVTKSPRSHEIVGCVFVEDLSIKSDGVVSDYTSMGVLQLAENAPLHQALQAFLTSKKQLAVITDKADEFVGVLTLQDIMSMLLLEPTAAPEPEIEQQAAVVPEEPTTESDQTVVE